MRKSGTTMLFMLLAAFTLVAGGTGEVEESGERQLVLLVKSLGNGFFEAVADGGKEAAAELDNVISVYTGPRMSTVEAQIEILEGLIDRGVEGIAVSANDPDALVPVTRKAMKAGIEVISFDSAIVAGGRTLDLAPSDPELIGRQQIQLIAELTGYSGQIGIVSSTPHATNQNEWIRWMREELKQAPYREMELVEVVYGYDTPDQSYRGAVDLMSDYPGLTGIVAPTTIGIQAAAKAIEDEGRQGRVALTGLGLPSEMQRYILSGTCGKMALWNPVDLGYTSTYILYRLLEGEISGVPGEEIDCGRMGTLTVGPEGQVVMGRPSVFDSDNIGYYARIF